MIKLGKKIKTLKEYERCQKRKIIINKIVFIIMIFIIIFYFVYNKLLKHQPVISNNNTINDVKRG